MRHQEATVLLPRLAAGTLRALDERRLRRHLDGCEECRGWLETYALLSDSLGATSRRQSHASSDELARLAVDSALLTAAELEALSEHLEACDDCRRELRLAREGLARAGRHGRVVERGSWASPAAVARLAVAACLALAVGIGFDAHRSPPLAAAADAESDAPATDQLFADRILRGVQVLEAAGSLTASEVTVEVGAEVTLRAGDAVVLGDGFAVGDGASLKIENIVKG